MKGITPAQAEMLGSAEGWGEHPDPSSASTPFTGADAELLQTLVDRGYVVLLNCPHESCPYSHPKVTAIGREALKIHKLLGVWPS